MKSFTFAFRCLLDSYADSAVSLLTILNSKEGKEIASVFRKRTNQPESHRFYCNIFEIMLISIERVSSMKKGAYQSSQET